MLCDAIYFNKIIFCFLKKKAKKCYSVQNKKKKENKIWVRAGPLPLARIGPDSGPIFPAHIRTGLFSPSLKSPLTDRTGPPVLTALV